MIAYLLLGVALLMSLLLLARWVSLADPHLLAKGVRYGGGAVAVGIALLLLVSGRWPYAMAALSAALPLLVRWRAWWSRMRADGGSSAGKRSAVETAMLRMSLDHDTGEMAGSVRQGAFAGRTLDALSRAELAALLEECRARDAASVSLLETYLDRRLGPEWRTAAETGGGEEAGSGDRQRMGPAADTMTRREALNILGLEEGASRDQIKDAHRRLMMKLHPDVGGSAYFASKLNQAKDVLLAD